MNTIGYDMRGVITKNGRYPKMLAVRGRRSIGMVSSQFVKREACDEARAVHLRSYLRRNC
jgi:hypothetical protein